ncbi:MAG: ROK family protein [Eubacteriales bacterium]
MYGAIEAGGTKFVCAVFDKEFNIITKTKIDTREPEYTMGEVIKFFADKNISSFGIGCFGPVEINPDSEKYGTILNTPKIKWRNYNLIDDLKKYFNIPIKIDTDVNAAALGEYKMGHGIGKRSVLYITIGTGVGAGFVIEGKTLYGLSHPEMGHVLVRQMKEDEFEGNCPTHKNCLEGLVSGPAIEKRYNTKAHLLGKDHKVWEYVADYIGQALMTYNLIISPEIILIGGGVSQQEQLFDKIRTSFKKHMNGYIDNEVLNGSLEDYIVYPKNGQMAGLYGAAQLSSDAFISALSV